MDREGETEVTPMGTAAHTSDITPVPPFSSWETEFSENVDWGSGIKWRPIFKGER